MNFINNNQENSWGSMSYADKNRELYLKQKQIIPSFTPE